MSCSWACAPSPRTALIGWLVFASPAFAANVEPPDDGGASRATEQPAALEGDGGSRPAVSQPAAPSAQQPDGGEEPARAQGGPGAEPRPAASLEGSEQSETARVLAEQRKQLELAAQQLVRLDDEVRAERKRMAARRDETLGWARKAKAAEAAGPDEADATYDALRVQLRAARDELARALDTLGGGGAPSVVLPADPLPALPAGPAVDDVRQLRRELEEQVRAADDQQAQLGRERAADLLDEIDRLNRDRLSLLSSLSAQKRAALTGFTQEGFDQGRAEARHLLLSLRYHRQVVTGWLKALRGGQGVAGVSWRLIVVAVPWILAVLAFVWARRRTPVLLAVLERRAAGDDYEQRRTTAGLARRSIRFLRGIHRPLESLALFGVMVWLLPDDTRQVLEAQLLTVVVGWSLTGSLVVDFINALVATTDASATQSSGELNRLRLRSLRLVGRVVVGFALSLVLTARLVGVGTIHSWVLSTVWVAAVLVFLVLVRWWRPTVFERVERTGRKSRLRTWVLANRAGWKSFPAATIAAVQMFVLGSVKTVRNWLGGFTVARRAAAYLFKRELERMAGENPARRLEELDGALRAKLAPDRCGTAWVACPADEHLELLARRAAEGKGGLVAIVGHRGRGKSSLLRRLAGRVTGAQLLELDRRSPLEAVTASFQGAGAEAPRAMLLDDAQGLVQPVMGGLKRFDEVTAWCRAQSSRTLWVFAFDGAVWPFLRRARDSRPVFDEVVMLEPWSAEEIGALLSSRSEEAGIAPTFDDLLELPAAADELDRRDALDAKRQGYYQMIWDYASGNPGVALQAWRSSLAQDAGGVRVRPLQVPAPDAFERLPDESLFVLRAVLQMAPAQPRDVTLATRLSEAQVIGSIRFAQNHGWVIDGAGGIEISWTYLRPIMVLLERRHLLVGR